MKPEFGDLPRALKPNEIPVFWACGVTPQSVLEKAKPDFCITHSPGKMLITDKLNGSDVKITKIAQGMPFGAELNYVDEGTLTTAMKARKPI